MTAKLNEYNQKRNFERTFEPEGKTEDTEESLRFVVQHHMARNDHYDLRLEWDEVLLSWAVPKGPSFDTHDLPYRWKTIHWNTETLRGLFPKVNTAVE